LDLGFWGHVFYESGFWGHKTEAKWNKKKLGLRMGNKLGGDLDWEI